MLLILAPFGNSNGFWDVVPFKYNRGVGVSPNLDESDNSNLEDSLSARITLALAFRCRYKFRQTAGRGDFIIAHQVFLSDDEPCKYT